MERRLGEPIKARWCPGIERVTTPHAIEIQKGTAEFLYQEDLLQRITDHRNSTAQRFHKIVTGQLTPPEQTVEWEYLDGPCEACVATAQYLNIYPW